jgi:hypothetical protein
MEAIVTMEKTAKRKLPAPDWKLIIVLVWIVANTWLLSQGHKELSSEVLRVSAQSARSCSEALK